MEIASFYPYLTLQWSRDDDVAESPSLWWSMLAINPLQWSRDDDVAESRPTLEEIRSFRDGFNGAATMMSRKGDHGWEVERMLGPLQWSRDDDVAERARLCASSVLATSFNGAATMMSRKGAVELGLVLPRHQLQWSRDDDVAERRVERSEPCLM